MALIGLGLAIGAVFTGAQEFRYSRGGRRCWVEMLKLNVRGDEIKIEKFHFTIT
jgi:hypothetical protein